MPEGDSISLLPILIAIGLVLVAGLMALIDTALLSLNRSELAEMAESARSKKTFEALSADPVTHSNSLNFVRVLSETTAAVLIAITFHSIFDNFWLAFLIAAGVMTITTFFLVGVSPRSIAREYPQTILKLTAWLARFVRILLGPIANALVFVGNRVTPGRSDRYTVRSEEQILDLVDEAAERDVLEDDDRELIHSVFEFSDTLVREVMVPRPDMVTLETGVELSRALDVFLTRGISRIPVIDSEQDTVLGVIHLRDLVRTLHRDQEKYEHASVDKIMRKAMFIPDSKKVDDTLKQMQQESNHIALLIDEYGGVSGLVTLEDIIEELVGDISDEHDRETAEVKAISEDSFVVSARLPIDELGELFELELNDEDVDTVGGLFTKALGRLPAPDSQVEYAGLEFSVARTEGKRKRVSSILVRKLESSETTNLNAETQTENSDLSSESGQKVGETK